MKSIKFKLFVSYAITIFVVLVMLFGITLYFFDKNKHDDVFEKIDNTYVDLEHLIIEEDDIDISNIDKDLSLANQVLIIVVKDKIVFSNQSQYKTREILKEFYDEYDDEENDDDFNQKVSDSSEYDGFVEIDDYLLSIHYIKKENINYEVYLGVNEKFMEDSINSIYTIIIALSIIMFVVLLVLGYILIHRTINPLKQVLQELEALQSNQDLSKRLVELDTNDEFQELTQMFNTMLNNIQKSVESIKQFSSDASHELRTPLTVIQGEIELVKNRDVTLDELKRVIEKIDTQQKSLQEIINSFLLLSRLDKEFSNSTKVSLDKCVFESLENHLEGIESKQLELKLDIEDNVFILFDERYLLIILNNLLSNALKYTTKGSITLRVTKKNDQGCFEITDTGEGISKEDLQKVFERFYRVDKVRTSAQDGIGLGLSIVQRICEKFNATIELKSELHKGSKFTVSFPLSV